MPQSLENCSALILCKLLVSLEVLSAKQKSAEGISLETLAIVHKGVPVPTLLKAPTPCPACPAFFM